MSTLEAVATCSDLFTGAAVVRFLAFRLPSGKDQQTQDDKTRQTGRQAHKCKP